MYKSFVSLGRYTPKYFILFVAMVNGLVSLISLYVLSLLVYNNARVKCLFLQSPTKRLSPFSKFFPLLAYYLPHTPQPPTFLLLYPAFFSCTMSSIHPMKCWNLECLQLWFSFYLSSLASPNSVPG